MSGERPYESRDRAGNVWPLAIPSLGESWHNLHHADPTCARHDVGRRQVDISARTIRRFERFGWASDVRRPAPARPARLRRATTPTSRRSARDITKEKRPWHVEL